MAIFSQLSPLAELDAAAPNTATPKTLADAPLRGLSLQSLTLTRGFEGLANLWNAANEIYVVCYAWDTAGGPVQVFPAQATSEQESARSAQTPAEAAPQTWISLRRGQTHQYLGAGLPIVSPMRVQGGLYVRLQLWESDRSARRAGLALAEIRRRIASPELQALLGAAAGAFNIGGAGALAALNTALGQTTDLLRSNGDDVVDLFEGLWPANQPWPTAPLVYEGGGSRVVLQPL